MDKLLLILLCFLLHFVNAQDFMKGKMNNANSEPSLILYDRTQLPAANDVYQTNYKLYTAQKKPLCTVTLKNNRVSKQFSITVRPENGASFGSTTKYDPSISGLIFSNEAKPDTSFSMQNRYAFLFSCADTVLDYLVLHKFVLNEHQEIELDPLSKNRIKKHNEIMLRHLEQHPYLQKVMMGKEEEFYQQLLQQRNELREKENNYIQEVNTLANELQKQAAEIFGKKSGNSKGALYSGEKRKGLPDGRGLLIIDRNIYSGIFSEGKLIKGTVRISNAEFEYTGYFSNDTFNGTGWLRFTNGNYRLGNMLNGVLANGVEFNQAEEGELFWGAIANSTRTGYAQLKFTNGDKTIGEFNAAKLVKGYTKETDEYGNTDYFKTEDDKETIMKPVTAEKYFNGLVVSNLLK